MKIKRGKGEYVFGVFNYLFLLLFAFITLYPFFYVLFASFSEASRLEYYSGLLLRPLGFSLDAYKAVLKNREIWIGYRNTLFYVFFGTVSSVICTGIAGYVSSRHDFFWNKFLQPFIAVTMFLNGGLIPTFIVLRGLGLYNNVLVLILPGLIGVYNMFVMRTGFESVPKALEESALIDGANHIYIFIKIVVPLSLPTIAVIALYCLVGHWNSWFTAMIYLRDRKLFLLQLFLREILIANETAQMDQFMDAGKTNAQTAAEAVKYAVTIVSVVPILCIYPFIQRYFVKGVMIGAVKG